MKLSKKSIGKIVKVSFWDHSLHTGQSAEIFKCWVVGEISRINKKELILKFWQCKGQPDSDEYIALVRKTIIKIKYLTVV